MVLECCDQMWSATYCGKWFKHSSYHLCKVSTDLWPPILIFISACTVPYLTCFTRFGKFSDPYFENCDLPNVLVFSLWYLPGYWLSNTAQIVFCRDLLLIIIDLHNALRIASICFMPFRNFRSWVPVLAFALSVCHLRLIQPKWWNISAAYSGLSCSLFGGKKMMMISQDQSCQHPSPHPENTYYVTALAEKWIVIGGNE